eukprot:803044-Pelagomonas_calceolata.AAC.8
MHMGPWSILRTKSVGAWLAEIGNLKFYMANAHGTRGQPSVARPAMYRPRLVGHAQHEEHEHEHAAAMPSST